MRYVVIVSGLLAALGLLLGEAAFTAAASMILGFGYAALDLLRAREGRMSALLLFGFFVGVAGTADLAGLGSLGTPWESQFFIYAVREYLPQAQVLMYVGTLAMIGGYAWAARHVRPWRFLPAVRARTSWRGLPWLVCATALGCSAAMARGFDLAGGTFSDAFRMAPSMAAFFLARFGADARVGHAVALGVVVALVESGRAVLYSYLRFGMVFPFLAVALGVVVGGRSLKALRSPLLLPIVIALAVMAPYAGTFARTREHLPRGPERLAELGAIGTQDTSGWITTLARFATFNQTTQVLRLVDEEGLLEGETLGYWTYALVPRVLWPSKPTIAQGQWFAERLRLGRLHSDAASFSNSINMTLPGEWYLNFGWSGTVVGCFLAGVFVAVLWGLCGFSAGARDVLASLLGFRLLWGAWTLLGDLQQVVSLTAYCVIFAVAAWLLETARKAPAAAARGTRRHAARGALRALRAAAPTGRAPR